LSSATTPEIFPRRQKPRNILLKKRDTRLLGHDGKSYPNPEFNHNLKKIAIDKRQYESGNSKEVRPVEDWR
jgi:hypothetical protein